MCLTGWLDVRYDARNSGQVAEFSWEGEDEGHQHSGRIALETGRPWATSTSTAPTIQASSADRGEFFNGLVVPRIKALSEENLT